MTNIYRPIIFFAHQNKIIISRLTKKLHHTFRVTIEQKHQIKTTVLGRQNFFSSILHCDINVTDHCYFMSARTVHDPNNKTACSDIVFDCLVVFFVFLFIVLLPHSSFAPTNRNSKCSTGQWQIFVFLTQGQTNFFFPRKICVGWELTFCVLENVGERRQLLLMPRCLVV